MSQSLTIVLLSLLCGALFAGVLLLLRGKGGADLDATQDNDAVNNFGANFSASCSGSVGTV